MKLSIPRVFEGRRAAVAVSELAVGSVATPEAKPEAQM